MWGGGLGYTPKVCLRAQEVVLARVHMRAVEDTERRLMVWISVMKVHDAHVRKLIMGYQGRFRGSMEGRLLRQHGGCLEAAKRGEYRDVGG